MSPAKVKPSARKREWFIDIDFKTGNRKEGVKKLPRGTSEGIMYPPYQYRRASDEPCLGRTPSEGTQASNRGAVQINHTGKGPS